MYTYFYMTKYRITKIVCNKIIDISGRVNMNKLNNYFLEQYIIYIHLKYYYNELSCKM